jgi:4-hydroxy-tetrahydrodipicolinate reductase
MNAPTEAPIRVFQVATGNVGTEMIKRIGNHPDLDLIGLHCYTAEKVGRDAGEIAGLAPNGVIATGSADEIIAAKPDVLTFNGVLPDLSALTRTVKGEPQPDRGQGLPGCTNRLLARLVSAS